MKLRIYNDSIRLRLTRSEVSRFAADGIIGGVLQYGAGPDECLAYGLESGDADRLKLSVGPSRMVIMMPAAQAREWTGTDRIAVGGSSENAAGIRFTILVEKEFRRLHGATNDPDLYPNPLEERVAVG